MEDRQRQTESHSHRLIRQSSEAVCSDSSPKKPILGKIQSDSALSNRMSVSHHSPKRLLLNVTEEYQYGGQSNHEISSPNVKYRSNSSSTRTSDGKATPPHGDCLKRVISSDYHKPQISPVKVDPISYFDDTSGSPSFNFSANSLHQNPSKRPSVVKSSEKDIYLDCPQSVANERSSSSIVLNTSEEDINKYPTSPYIHLSHSSERSIFISYCLTLFLCLLSILCLGPMFGILIPVLILSKIWRSLLDRFCCCRHSYLSSRQRLWLNKSQAPFIILLGVEGDSPVELSCLQELICHRVVEIENVYGQRLYPHFSQKIVSTSAGYVWQKDESFRVENHVTPVLNRKTSIQNVIGTLESQSSLNWEQPLWDIHVLWRERLPHSNPSSSPTQPTLVIKKLSKHETLSPHSPQKLCESSRSVDCGKSISETWLIIRIHPVMGDGVSLVHLFCTALGDSNARLRLKERYAASGQCLNFLRSFFIAPIVILRKWLLTKRDYNLLHPSPHYCKLHGLCRTPTEYSTPIQAPKQVVEMSEDLHDMTKLSNTSNGIRNDATRTFRWRKLDLSQVSRLKQVTRSTFNDLFLSLVAGALRSYQQMRGIDHPFDLLTLIPVDTTEEFHLDLKLRNNFTLVDVCLPVNTEGMLPRLWEVKQRMDELKASANISILSGLLRISQSLLPLSWGNRIMNYYFDKVSCITSNLQGPEIFIQLDKRVVKTLAFWFPPVSQVDLTITFFSYADHISVAVSGSEALMPHLDILIVAMRSQLDLLSHLLENRRIPGEHRSLVMSSGGLKQQSSQLQKAYLEREPSEESEGELISGEVIVGAGTINLGPSAPSFASSQHRKSTAGEIHLRLARIQLRLQDSSKVPSEELDSLRQEFSELIRELRRRKSVISDDNREFGDFDEELDLEETLPVNTTGTTTSTTQRGRRPSLPAIVGLGTTASRRRSVASSITRPLSGVGPRSRSGSRVTTTHIIHTPHVLFKEEYSDDVCEGVSVPPQGISSLSQQFCLTNEHIQIHCPSSTATTSGIPAPHLPLLSSGSFRGHYESKIEQDKRPDKVNFYTRSSQREDMV